MALLRGRWVAELHRRGGRLEVDPQRLPLEAPEARVADDAADEPRRRRSAAAMNRPGLRRLRPRSEPAALARPLKAPASLHELVFALNPPAIPDCFWFLH